MNALQGRNLDLDPVTPRESTTVSSGSPDLSLTATSGFQPRAERYV